MSLPEPLIHIVEDDPQVSRSVAALVRSRGLAAETYASGEDFLQRADRSRPGCVVLDWRLPGIDGGQVQDDILAWPQPLPTVFVSGVAGVATAVEVLQKGALTILEKPCPDDVVLQAIEQALAVDARQREQQRRQDEAVGRLALLTEREREVLTLVIAGLANKQISTRLDVSVRTVELDRSRIHEKTNTRSVAALVRLAIEANFPLPSRDEQPSASHSV